MEEPQPEAPQSEGVEASTQPVASEAPMAEQPQTESQPEAPSEDDTADWLSKKGLDPNDPEFATKLAKSYREAEKLAMQATRKASELEKTLSANQPQQGDDTQELISEYRPDKMLNSFKESVPDWQAYEQPMAELLSEAVSTNYGVFTRSQLVNEGILSLTDVYLMAKSASPVNTENIKRDAQKEVLQTLANTQRAGGATPNAVNSSPQAIKSDPILDAIKKARGNG